MINLEDIINDLNIEAAIRLNEPLNYYGDFAGVDSSLEKIRLVLNQTFDALEIPPFRQIIINGTEKNILVIYYKDSILGIIYSGEITSEEIMRYVYEKSGVVEIEKEEFEEVEEEEKKEEEEEVEEVIEEDTEKIEEEEVEQEEPEEETYIIEKEIINPEVINRIGDVSNNYLGDFSLDIVSNVIDDVEMNRENPTKDQILAVVNSLENAASLIIGPSKAGKLKEDILKIIKEEG